MKKLYENPFALVVEVEEIDCLFASCESDIASNKTDTHSFGYFGNFGM